MKKTTKQVLQDLVEAIDVTGGVVRDDDGIVSPVADPEWSDLGNIYLDACKVLSREPVIAEADSGLEDAEEASYRE